jgi:carboxyl-terminal processing protease
MTGMNRRTLLFLGILAVLAGFAFRTVLPEVFPYPELKVFSQAYMLILTKFVDPVKDEMLLHGAQRGLMNTLDPFSAVIPADKLKAFQATLDAKKDLDCGLELRRGGRFVFALRVHPGGAADGVIRPWDVIEEVDGLKYPRADVWEMQNALAGPLGRSIKVRFAPRDVEKSQEAVLVIKPYAALRIAVRYVEGIPVLALPHLQDHASRSLREALAEIKAQDLLFLDLRGTGSFNYTEALKTAALFTKEPVSLEFKTRKGTQKESRPGEAVFLARELMVITDRGTTGAAETLAALLKKHAKAQVIGRTTFGYSGQQKLIPLSDGGACYLTTSIAGLPGGEDLMRKGVTPDILVKESGAADRDESAIDKKVQDLIREKIQKKAA